MDIIVSQSGSHNESIDNKNIASHLKLVVSNLNPVKEERGGHLSDLSLSTASLKASAPEFMTASTFAVDVQMASLNQYIMFVKDASHLLECRLELEVGEPDEDDEDGSTTVSCHFPLIADDQLNDLTWGDEALHGMIIVRFQMKILEQLFLFCAEHYATNLMIIVDTAHAPLFTIYKDFVLKQNDIVSANVKKTTFALLAHHEVYDQWVDLMENVFEKFSQILWREQKTNVAIRYYMKNHNVINL